MNADAPLKANPGPRRGDHHDGVGVHRLEPVDVQEGR